MGCKELFVLGYSYSFQFGKLVLDIISLVKLWYNLIIPFDLTSIELIEYMSCLISSIMEQLSYVCLGVYGYVK